MNLALKPFKLENGVPNYPVLFQIPSTERVPALAANDFTKINMLLVGALTIAFETMGLKKGMTPIQIVDLSENIIDSAAEDNLSLEDIILFLQNLVRGKYEIPYESLDNIPKFMKIFEIYREERHQTKKELEYNSHLQFKGLGPSERTVKYDELSEHFSRLGETLNNLKEGMKELKQENKKLKDIDSF